MALGKIIQVAVGGDRIIALTEDGEVLMATAKSETQLTPFIKVTPKKAKKNADIED